MVTQTLRTIYAMADLDKVPSVIIKTIVIVITSFDILSQNRTERAHTACVILFMLTD